MGLQFQFEPKNFIAGLMAGWASAFVLYLARDIIGEMRRSVEQRADVAGKYATRSAEGRYVRDLLKFCEANHLAGGTIELSKILVEPRFIPAPQLAAPPDEEVNREPFRVIPQIHDYPYLHAPYNVHAASIEELGNGDRAIALLGHPGSGRTTALQAIAMWSLSSVDFKPKKDSVQIQIEAEEAALKADERADRIKRRLQLEEDAYERLAEEQGSEFDAAALEARKSGVSVLKRLLPVYVHLANVNPVPSEFGRRADPAEPLVRAVQYQVGRVTSKVLPRKLYERLNKGGTIVLLDGFDDLSEDEQKRRLPWLRAFLREYRKNFIIVAGPADGYGALTRLGLTPVYLRPWHDMHIHECAEKWADNWSQLSGNRRRENVRPAESLVDMAKAGTRGYTPFDVALRIRGIYTAELQEESTPLEWMQTYLQALGITDELLPKAAQAAALQLNEGFITVQRLHDVALGRPAPVKIPAKSVPATKTSTANVDAMFNIDDADDEDVDTIFEGADIDDDLDEQPDLDSMFSLDDLPDEREPEPAPTPEAPAAVVEEPPATTAKPPAAAKEQVQLVKSLERMGLIQRYRGNRYLFRDPLVAAYLASLTLTSETVLVEKVTQPAWEWALAYAAGHTPVDLAVAVRLESSPDLLYNNLLSVTRWLSYAPGKVDWRTTIMKQLGNLFVASNQYPAVRERVAAALVGTHDKNALVIFQQSIRNSNPVIRRLSCLGIGAMQEVNAVNLLSNALEDHDPDVQIAACLSLGAIATDESLEAMTSALASGGEQVQRAAAEAFAAIPGEGYPVLYEAARNEDLSLRRAAVFGLRRVSTSWALIDIYRIFLEDDQWYVQSAAQEAFIDMQDNSHERPRGYPSVQNIPWLREWIEALGEEGVSSGPDQALLKVLNEADSAMQAVSAQAIGQLGMADKIDELYAALLHSDEAVRVAAHRALSDLQAQMGIELPVPA